MSRCESATGSHTSLLILTTNTACSISPSVYVAYRDLRASDICPSFGNGDFTRGVAYNTTIAYRPGILSTSMCTGAPQGFYRGFAALNLTQLQYPTSYNGTCEGLDISMESTTNGPYLSMPIDLTRIDPAWSTCDVVYWGAFDPPIALHTATALVQDPGNSPTTPAPGSPVAPPYAPATPTATPVNIGNPETHSYAPKATPKDPKPQNPHSPDPVNSPTNSPRPAPQDPDVSKAGPPDPVQKPSNDDKGDPAASAAFDNPPNGGNVAHTQGELDPASSDPQSTSSVNEKGTGSDPANGNTAGPILNPAENADQSPADHAQPLPSIGGHQIQTVSGGGVIIASSTLQLGLQTTIDGTPLSVDKGRIVIASSTVSFTLPSADPILTLINGDIISAGGQAATVSGTTVALAPNDDALVVNGKTSPLPPRPIPLLTVAGQIYTPAPTGFAIEGQSVLPGGPAVTFAGSTFSLASGSNALIVNDVPTPLPSAAISIFKIGSQAFTPAPTGFAVGSQSVLPGGPALTVAGSTFSLASGSNALIINGKPTPIAAPTPTSIFKVGSHTFTAAPTGFAIGTQSVSPGGPALTVDGTVVSLDSSDLIIDTSTVPLVGSSAQAGVGGNLIMYGVDGGGAKSGAKPTNGSDVVPFLGESGQLRVAAGTVVIALILNLGTAIIRWGSL